MSMTLTQRTRHDRVISAMETTLAGLAVSEEVRRGIELLDERVPGWDGYIDLGTFNIREPMACVLGQVYDGDGYYTGLEDLGLSANFEGAGDDEPTHAWRYGFTVRDGNSHSEDSEWDHLQGEWERAIRARRGSS
jgi:hypothetical protein